MAATIQQIAELAGVSRGTVDRVLNDRGRVKPEVRERVEQIARELGYVPRRRRGAGSAPGQRRWRLGVVTQLAHASFMREIDRGIEDMREPLERRGFELALRAGNGVDEAEQLRALDELDRLGIDGLAIMPVDCDVVRARLARMARERHIPIVTFNTDVAGAGQSCYVGLDNRQCGRTAAGLMGMMTGGSGQVLGILGYFSNSASSRRIDGFVEELKDRFPRIELVGIQSSHDRAAEVERIVASTAAAYPELKGIFLTSGGQSGVRSALEGLPPAQRPRVILCDLTDENAGLLRDGLADFIIDQDCYRQGHRALALLADQIEWGQAPEREYLYTEIRIKTRYNL